MKMDSVFNISKIKKLLRKHTTLGRLYILLQKGLKSQKNNYTFCFDQHFAKEEYVDNECYSEKEEEMDEISPIFIYLA